MAIQIAGSMSMIIDSVLAKYGTDGMGCCCPGQEQGQGGMPGVAPSQEGGAPLNTEADPATAGTPTGLSDLLSDLLGGMEVGLPGLPQS